MHRNRSLAAALSLALTALAGCSGGGHTSPANVVPQTRARADTLTADPSINLDLTANAPATQTSTSGTSSMPFAPTPDPDPFYAQPSPFPNLRPGTILASRATTYAPDAVTQPNPAWQIKFVSRDLRGNPIASVATVVRPLVPFAGGPAPLVAVPYYENSLGSKCAPSHSTTGSTANNPSNTEGSLPLAGLAQGMTLVFPDHLGPYTEYGVALLHARVTLDAIRAALAFTPLGLNATSPVGIEGYSGGAIATAWAATIRKAYAPELNVVAIASGGTPANLKDVLEQFDNNAASNSLFSIGLDLMLGINRAWPNFLTPYLNQKGIDAANTLKDGCGGQPSQTGGSVPTGHFADYTTVADPLNLSSIDAILAKNDLPNGRTPIDPLYVYHSQVDELVPVGDTDSLVNTWCGAGVHVAYYRGLQGDHISFDLTMAPTVFTYLASRFRGEPEATPAGTTTCN